jgi:hypothetical protein
MASAAALKSPYLQGDDAVLCNLKGAGEQLALLVHRALHLGRRLTGRLRSLELSEQSGDALLVGLDGGALLSRHLIDQAAHELGLARGGRVDRHGPVVGCHGRKGREEEEKQPEQAQRRARREADGGAGGHAGALDLVDLRGRRGREWAPCLCM